MKSVLGFNISHKSLLDTLHRSLGFKVSGLLFFQKVILVLVCEHITEVQGPFMASAMIRMVWFMINGYVGLLIALQGEIRAEGIEMRSLSVVHWIR
jgi:hypothetical protein